MFEMDMKRHDFESSIKCSDSYAKLIYMHGEKLFIFDDGKYKIAAMQLAWEIYCDRFDEIEGLKKKQAKVEELQKRVDAALEEMEHESLKLSERDDGYKDPVGICQAEGIEIAKKILEQALKGEA